MASNETYREISNLFGVCETVCCQTVHRMGALFTKYVVPRVIKWPSPAEKIEISYDIESAKGFPGVIGMIDGCHIPVKKTSWRRCSLLQQKRLLLHCSTRYIPTF